MKNLTLPDFRVTENRRKRLAAAVGCACALLLGGASAMAQSLSGSSLAISGSATIANLSVTGTGDFWGNSLSFGTSSLLSTGSSAVAGVMFTFSDGTPSLLKATAAQSSHEWLWERATDGLAPTIPMMRLDSNHVLTLYDISGNAAIVFDPNSTGGGMLTQAAADGRYLMSGTVSGSNAFAGPGATASATNSLALGAGALTRPAGNIDPSSDGGGEIALGASAISIGQGSIALGNGALAGTEDGAVGIAIGHDASASGGWESLALGGGAIANGGSSVALGSYSGAYADGATAIGQGAMALAVDSLAFATSRASGLESRALGYYSYASGGASVSLGVASSACGGLSMALGASSGALGSYSVTLGAYSIASGTYSVASGANSRAEGEGAVASGYGARAMAAYSVASAYNALAQGNYSTAAGANTSVQGYGQFAIGQYNVLQGNSNQWMPTDDLFVVGNGTDGDHRSNALTVKKNGDTTINGSLAITGSSSQITLNGSPLLSAAAAQQLLSQSNISVTPDVYYSTISIGSSNTSSPATVVIGNSCSAIGSPDSGAPAAGAVAIGQSCTTGTADGSWLGGLGAWNGVAIGEYCQATGVKSIALGSGATASGWLSTAIGYSAKASAWDATAIGSNTEAAGAYQFVIGQYNLLQGSDWDWVPTDDLFVVGNGTDALNRSNAFTVKKNGDTTVNGSLAITGSSSQITLNGSPLLTEASAAQLFGQAGNPVTPDGYGTISIGTSNSSASGAIVIGNSCSAGNADSPTLTGIGAWSGVAIGENCQATGPKSIALGTEATAGEAFSIAIGYAAKATGEYATAIGSYLDAGGAWQFVIGQYNLQQGSPWEWVPTDELFVVGNGTDSSHRSNAFTVKKNGDTTVNGNLNVTGNVTVNGQPITGGGSGSNLVAEQGDLSMGEFTSGPQPSQQ